MPGVVAWPPVFMRAEYLSSTRPGQIGTGAAGTAIYTQAQPTRRRWRATVHGVGPDGLGHGYIEALKDMLDGVLPLVRVRPLPRHWARLAVPTVSERGLQPVSWSEDGEAMSWTWMGSPVAWSTLPAITGTAGTAEGVAYLDCTGYPANTLIALPGERVQVGTAQAFVTRRATSDETGAVRLYLTRAMSSGTVVVGERESIVMRVDGFPETLQEPNSAYFYRFEMIEAFAEEYADGFTEVDPW
jgi:hypothetical protein